VAPQLATLVRQAPSGAEWLHEVKFDGYRILAVVIGGTARLFTRRGLDWTDRFPAVVAACESLPVRQTVLDGEVVALLPDGRSSFQALQQAMSGNSHPIVYYVFDLLQLDGTDLRCWPLIERKRRLAALLHHRSAPGSRAIRYARHVVGQGARALARACRRGLEGIVSKRMDAPYRSARTRTWLKVKCLNRQEFVVVGFTEPRGHRRGVGALLLGVYSDRGELEYCGKVGTGMSELLLRELRGRLEPLARRTPPVAGPVSRGVAGVTWVEPRLVVEVAFTEWTRDGRLRHPAFVGLREDKAPRQVRREKPAW
jgi:bifunctional non-homologous end joining protein LigD